MGEQPKATMPSAGIVRNASEWSGEIRLTEGVVGAADSLLSA